MNDIVIGIDVGLKGGLAYFDVQERQHEGHGLILLKPMPTTQVAKSDGKNKTILDVDRLLFILETPNKRHETATVVMEDVHAFPGQGVVAVGTLLEQKGIILGMCKALGYQVELVQPKKWQSYFGIVCPKDLKGKDKRKKFLKAESMKRAKVDFIDWLDHFDTHGDGLADASLIGSWFLKTAPV